MRVIITKRVGLVVFRILAITSVTALTMSVTLTVVSLVVSDGLRVSAVATL